MEALRSRVTPYGCRTEHQIFTVLVVFVMLSLSFGRLFALLLLVVVVIFLPGDSLHHLHLDTPRIGY